MDGFGWVEVGRSDGWAVAGIGYDGEGFDGDVEHPALARIGHPFGPLGLAAEVRDAMLVLDAEKCPDVGEIADRLGMEAESILCVRPLRLPASR